MSATKGRVWRLRYYVACCLIAGGLRLMPRCRYRAELSASLWTVGLRVMADDAQRGHVTERWLS